MTHDELLAKIDGTGFTYGEDYVWKVDGKQVKKGTNALRAVVELHKPIISTAYPESLGICLTCTPSSLNFYEATRYPCPTIQAIEKELS